MKKIFYLLLLLSASLHAQQKSRVFKDANGVWWHEQQTVISDTSAIPDPPKVTPKPPDPPKPPANVVYVSAGQSIKQAVEKPYAPGILIKIADGTFNEPNISVPVGVSIEGSGKTIINGTELMRYTPGGKVDAGVFTLLSTTRTNGNQSVSNLTINNKQTAIGGVLVSNRNNVKVFDITVNDSNFYGVWLRSSDNSEVYNLYLTNNSWCSVEWASGELCLGDLINPSVHHITARSTSPNRGYGIKALWPPTKIKNLKMWALDIRMNKLSNWQNGKSDNIGLELHDAQFDDFEIYDSFFGNQVSFESSRKVGFEELNDKKILRNCTFETNLDRYAVEVMISNYEMFGCRIKKTSMFAVNMQPNKKWRNQYIHDNVFEDPAPPFPWGAIFLIGKDGVENARYVNNTITQKGPDLVKYMGATGGVVSIPNTIIK